VHAGDLKGAPGQLTEYSRPWERADEAAEAVRALNHATMGWASQLRYPSDLADVVANLQASAAHTPQLCAQLATWLHGRHDCGKVGADNGLDPGEYVAAVIEALQRAGQDAELLAAALDSAYQAAAVLTDRD
jgi:hypothetical protein